METQETLTAAMKDTGKKLGCKGYCFCFDGGENFRHKSAAGEFKVSAFEFIRHARNERKSIKLFKNTFGEMAAQLSSEKE